MCVDRFFTALAINVIVLEPEIISMHCLNIFVYPSQNLPGHRVATLVAL
jgi:hypothetical protein